MSDLLSDDDLSALAAEFVLGTLDSEERTRASVLLDVDHQFRGLVRVWERRLGELHLMVEPVEPGPKIWARIRGRLPEEALAAAPTVVEPEHVPAAPAEDTQTPEQKLAELILEVERFSPPAADTPPTDEPGAELQPHPVEVDPAEEEPRPAGEIEPALVDTDAERIGPERISRDGGAGELVALERLPVRQIDEIPARERNRPMRRWRFCALFMMLVAFGLGSLIAAWRYIPDQLPSPLQPVAVLKIPDKPPPDRKPPPPSGQFDE